jgi:hypothetical protein
VLCTYEEKVATIVAKIIGPAHTIIYRVDENIDLI